jgi:glycosyltransferase involved in cell wall biosynthesis
MKFSETLGSVGQSVRSGLRVLIVTENASLRMSGETSIALYYFSKLRERGVEVWMLCHVRCRDELKETLPPEAFGRVTFIADSRTQIALSKFSRLFPYRISDLILGRVSHILTQWRARPLAQEMIRDFGIDIIFEPSPISPKGVSFMYGMGIPVVIGPMCGGLDLPPAFAWMDSKLTRASISAARLLARVVHRLVPGKLLADALIVGNQRTARALPPGCRGKIYVVVESGVEISRWTPKTHSSRPPGQPVRFVFCGRLVDWKGAQFLIEAFAALARTTDARLDVIGDGDLFGELKARISELGLEGRVTLLGRLPLKDCMDLIATADVYVMPSLRECGGLALLEAMAIGLPIIAANWAGPAEYLNSSCAILVDPSSREEFEAGLTEAMFRLAGSVELRQDLGAGARRSVSSGYFDWDSKTDRVLEILHTTLDRCRGVQ